MFQIMLELCNALTSAAVSNCVFAAAIGLIKINKYIMDAKLSRIYYSPKGYWKGLAAVKKLSSTAKVEEAVAKKMDR